MSRSGAKSFSAERRGLGTSKRAGELDALELPGRAGVQPGAVSLDAWFLRTTAGVAAAGISASELGNAVDQQFGPGRSVDANGFNYLEMSRYMHDQLLRDTDVFSMAHSVEVRVPFLDHKIVEYAAGVRPSQKVSNGVNKPLPVGGVDDPLLLQAGKRKKRGFSFPMDSWMKGYANELEEMAGESGCLDRTAVRGMWSDFRAGRLHWSRAWALTVLGAAG